MSCNGSSKRKQYATRGRRDLLDVLSNHRKPVSAKRLHELVGVHTCDLATVHRSLQHFVRAGLVHEIFTGGNSRCYEMNDQNHHHHHVSCTSCGNVEDIPLCHISPFTRYAEKKKGYEIRSHSFELFGVCPSCRRRK